MTAQTQPEALVIADLLDACDPDADLPFIATLTLASIKRTSAELRRQHAENAELHKAMHIPTIEKGTQEWLSTDPVIAWHLIDRYADNWADIGQMMQEYIDAQKQSAVERLEATIAVLEAENHNLRQRCREHRQMRGMKHLELISLKSQISELESNGPQVKRGEHGDGAPWFGTMRQAWEDTQQAAAAEANEVDRLRAELVREAQRTAAEKLRADQMSEQHSMQSRMNSEARAELARILTHEIPITNDQLTALKSARDVAMDGSIYARRPECSDFLKIEENLNAILERIEKR